MPPTPTKGGKPSSTSKRRVIVGTIFFVVALLTSRSFNNSFKSISDGGWGLELPTSLSFISDESFDSPANRTIAYAVSVTGCAKNQHQLYDSAAVLLHSIRLATRLSKYGYHAIAFFHPEAQACAPTFEKLGYEVQIRDTPLNESNIASEDLKFVQQNSCCGIKEYLKLYSYLQFDYPVVVHLDLDVLVLKPMDDVFDLMLDPSYDRSRIASMWLKPEEFPEQVDFVFTRDYNMVDPPRRQPHQIGVQGGFLVVRPNETDFNRMVDIILSGGGFMAGVGWGGREKAYGGYFGAGTIQGLASYYYGEYAQNRSLEVNRCFYNTMVDRPMAKHIHTGEQACRTLEETCQDCRDARLSEVYTVHYTLCGKPYNCRPVKSLGEHSRRLCTSALGAWHVVRHSLEEEWGRLYPTYNQLRDNATVSAWDLSHLSNLSRGHCKRAGYYVPLVYPPGFQNTTMKT